MRIRTLLIGSALLALNACSGGGDSRAGAADPSPSVVPNPSALTCEGSPTSVMFDYAGDATFTDLLTDWSRKLGRPWVDRDSETIWFLRSDGSAHTALRWAHAPDGPGSRAWFVDGYEQCSDAAEWSRTHASSTSVELTVGHCWVEPADFDGEQWDVVEEDQFGWGGGFPRGIAEPDVTEIEKLTIAGTLSPAGDVLVYVDEEGRHLTLVPAADPWTVPSDQRFCQ